MSERQKEIEENTKKAHKDFIMELVPYLIIIFFIVVIRSFIATPVRVSGSSMNPTLKHNDMMLLYKLTKKTKGIKRFDIVVVKTNSGKLIKRVIGLPKETIKYQVIKDKEGNKVATLFINGNEISEKFISNDIRVSTCDQDWNICEGEVLIPEGEYFVMGDNRGNSTDSRVIGTVKYQDIEGITKLTFFPFSRFGFKN